MTLHPARKIDPVDMKIAVSGELGSGKSVLCNKLALALGMEIISVGKIQRQLAGKYGMTTLEFNKYMETHPELDRECDAAVTMYGKEDRPLILDSRMAWHFVPHAFKIHLLADSHIAAGRIFNDRNRTNERYDSLAEAERNLMERKNSETLRFMQQYGVDINNAGNYNLVIDTSHLSPEALFTLVMERLSQYLRERNTGQTPRTFTADKP
jgi:cytidylate kinase